MMLNIFTGKLADHTDTTLAKGFGSVAIVASFHSSCLCSEAGNSGAESKKMASQRHKTIAKYM